MKKIILLLLLFAVPLFAQPGHNGFFVWEADSSSPTWQIVGTEIDTSGWYLSNPTMTFSFWPRDTTTGANGDSVALSVYFQSSPNKDAEHVHTATDTFSIVTANDSVSVQWLKTNVPTNSSRYFRLKIAGEAGNDKDAGSLIDIYYDGFPLNYR